MTLPRLMFTLLVSGGAAAWGLAAALLWLILADPLRALEFATTLTR